MNYSKRNTQKKQKKLRTPLPKLRSKVYVWFLRISIISILAALIIASYGGYGLVLGVIDNAPEINFNNIEPETFASTIYDNKGKEVYKLVGSNANRISVPLSSIPENLKNAFIAIEDERFYSHEGIDIKGIVRVSVAGIANGSLRQGASTITQQLLKNIVFSGGNESTTADKLQRKIQEQYLAVQLEKNVSKEVILENYLNTINLGQNTLGVQAASQRYFDKDVSKLTLSECAVIAGITKNPSSLNPISYPENNANRREDVLNKMLELNMITQKEYDKALSDNVYKRIQKVNKKKTKISNTVTSYFTDAVIDQVLKDLQKELGYTEAQATNLVYRGGLSIYTTQDKKMQKICDTVINDSSLYPFATEYALTYRLTITDKDGKITNYDEHSLEAYFKKSNSTFDLLFSSEKEAENYANLFRKYVLKKGCTVDGEVINTALQPQISFVLMDHSTGEIKALVGGRGNKTASRTLNRATSSVRQPGSTFKVLSAYLPAIDAGGMTLATVQDDAEFYYPGTGKRVKNWYGSNYRGLSTLREGIKDSMNVITVKTLADITPQVGFDYLKKLGFTTLVGDTSLPANDVNLSTALGGLTHGVTNIEATAAYASIANTGKYNRPILYTKILDHDGNVLIEKKPKQKQVMKTSTAFLLTSAMQDVVRKGTGTLAKLTTTSMPVAGKTGTTTKNVDVWFIGYTPYYTAGIWGGYDNNKQQSNTSYHKIIWRKVMEQIHSELPVKEFPQPSSIVTASICAKSGLLATEKCKYAAGGSSVRTEFFAGAAPTKYCDCHISVQVCSASGKMAGPYCPPNCIVTRSYLLKDETGPTADTPYVLSSKGHATQCTVHTNTISEVTPDDNLPKETGEPSDSKSDTSSNAPSVTKKKTDNKPVVSTTKPKPAITEKKEANN